MSAPANGRAVGSAFAMLLSLLGGLTWWVYNEHNNMQRQIDRLWEMKADKYDAQDRWRYSQHQEYAARVDAEIRNLQRQIDDCRENRDGRIR